MKKQLKKKIDWKVLIISLVIVSVVAAIGSLLVGDTTSSDWYKSIKPPITPPNFVFPVAWTILFFLIALSLYFAWISSNASQKKRVITVFAINFLLNMSWSFFYFTLRAPLPALINIIFLILSILSLIFVCFEINKKSAYLLVPYLLWVLFASLLNILSI